MEHCCFIGHERRGFGRMSVLDGGLFISRLRSILLLSISILAVCGPPYERCFFKKYGEIIKD